jgi:hypothetical protein
METGSTSIALMFEQILVGWDIPTPDSLLKVSEERAAIRLPGHPYSLLTNLAHALLWQEHWLAKLEGRPRKTRPELYAGDFRVPEPGEFKAIRAEFVEGLRRAKSIAESRPFRHSAESDRNAEELLIAIAVHGAYHLGQINLLKRNLLKAGKEGAPRNA